MKSIFATPFSPIALTGYPDIPLGKPGIVSDNLIVPV